MIPDWQRLAEEAPIVAALVVGLSKRTGFSPEAVLDTIAELLEEAPQPELRLVSDNPQAAA
jgi:hypothetical protein